MRLRNQVFQTQTETGKRRKLEIVLRSLTGDQLTAHQRRLIACAIGCCQQYRFQLCQKPNFLIGPADAGDGQAVIHRIFGSAKGGENQPAAVLVRCPARGSEANTVYIYLPEKEEKQRNDIRKKEAAAP